MFTLVPLGPSIRSLSLDVSENADPSFKIDKTIKKYLTEAEVVRRFTGLGYKKRSVYRWLDVIEKDETFKRKKGSGRPAKTATKLMLAKLRAYFNHKSGQHVYLGEYAAKEVNPASVPRA
ncbi:hypothetical protein BpHYR1_040777 [Brachionus plicatilis]|uniref:Uncharacterized protein n=1 Tax=Brachionus plicatilis TaxID=10195 RepID=A0A3M7Q223_BRAPC|nr:hypothetical protein BpHYR1_040777 [Brachionus plicatilis]